MPLSIKPAFAFLCCALKTVSLAIKLPGTELQREPVSGNCRRHPVSGYICPRHNMIQMNYTYTHDIDMKTLYRKMIGM